MKFFGIHKSTLSLFFLVILGACQKEEIIIPPPTENLLTENYDSEVPLKWFYFFEEIDRYAPGYRPPASARATAYIGLAGYEAAVHGMPQYQSLSNHFSGLVLPTPDIGFRYHWPAAVNAAYNAIFRKFYPHIRVEQKIEISNIYLTLQNKFIQEQGEQVVMRSAAFGEAVANAIFDWSAKDIVGHDAYLNPRPLDYVPPVGQGLWRPTPPDFTPALFPYWGNVRPFAMRQNDLIARPPLPWSEDPNSQFYVQAKEVEVWTNRVKTGGDFEGRWISEFWSDDVADLTFTPPGRWFAIANQVLDANQNSLDFSVVLYAQLGMALSDAAVGIWKSKFHYNLERPIDYIRRNFDPNWTTHLNNPLRGFFGKNPEFPAYPSGHSGFGGAAAYILAEFFGNNYEMTDNCHINRTEFIGNPRTFAKFTDMAVENAYSRIPLGVHYRMDCDEGLRMGYLAGQRVVQLPWKK
jgi:hypothetical protein